MLAVQDERLDHCQLSFLLIQYQNNFAFTGTGREH
jgi:hypothetical protein